jgi:hypothetical protein
MGVSHLLKSAESSWQTDKSTNTLRHFDLALVHRIDNNLAIMKTNGD